MANNGYSSRKRMSKKRRRQIVIRNRIIAISCVAIAVLVIFLLAAKGCDKKKDTKETSGGTKQTKEITQDTTEAITTTDNTGTETVATESTKQTEQATTKANLTSKGYKIEVIDGCTYIDGVLIANKTYSLPDTFIPTDPEVPVTAQWSTTSLDKTLMTNWRKMLSDATAKGLNIYIASGYRSYSQQVKTYNSYVATDGKALADTYSSRAGHSEHQTGLCFDLNSIEDSFQYTAEGKWVNDNCYKYGFCIRFPKGKDSYTGYQYESWHLRYVGVELATKLYNNGDWISLEEYFGITSKYDE